MAVLNLNKFSGLDTQHDWSAIDDDKLVALRNFDITEQGYLKRRSGFSTLTEEELISGKSLYVLARFTTPTFDRLIFTIHDDLELYYIDMTDATPTAVEISGMGGTGSAIQWAGQYGDKLYFITSNNDLQYYDGSTYAAYNISSTHSHGTHLVFWKDRGWIVNSAVNYDTLRYSEIASFSGTNDWANSDDIAFGNGDYLVCTVPFQDQLIIFKSRSTWMMDTGGSADPDDWILRELNPNIGCISRSTPIVFENLLYFESHDGVYRTDLSNFEEISAPIRNQFNTRAIDRTTTTYADYAAIIDDRYILYTNDGVSPKFWVYNIRLGGWSEYTPSSALVRPNGMFSFVDKSPGSLYFGSTAVAGHIFRFGDPTMLADTIGGIDLPINSFLQTKYLDMGEPGKWKRMTKAVLDYNARSTGMTCKWNFPNNTTSNNISLPASGGPQAVYRSAGPITPAGRFQSVSWSLADSDEFDISIYNLALEVQERDVIGKNLGNA